MCKAPRPPAQEAPEKLEFLRNPYLDAAFSQSGAVNQLRTGRSSLRLDLNSGLGIGGDSQPLRPQDLPTLRPPTTTPPIGRAPPRSQFVPGGRYHTNAR